MSKPMARKLNAWHVRHVRGVASTKHSFLSHIPNSIVSKCTRACPTSAYVHKPQAIYIGHVLRADPNNPIRLVLFNDLLQPRAFYFVANTKGGRPAPKRSGEVTNLLLQNEVICAKSFLAKHHTLRQTPKNIHDLYILAKGRAAFRALAASLVIKANRELPDMDFEDPILLE